MDTCRFANKLADALWQKYKLKPGFWTWKKGDSKDRVKGENGSGKSTLPEAIAAAWGFNPEGGTLNFSFHTRPSHSALHEYLRLARGVRRPKDGFFLRAESYDNAASYIEKLDEEEGAGPRLREAYGGKFLHEQSNVESFLAAFLHRFGGRGLYLLDEPEAALSPLRQMFLLVRMHELVGSGSQFIIATHSPILMSYPGAVILQLEEDGIRETALEETDRFAVTKAFMNDREGMLRDLLEEEISRAGTRAGSSIYPPGAFALLLIKAAAAGETLRCESMATPILRMLGGLSGTLDNAWSKRLFGLLLKICMSIGSSLVSFVIMIPQLPATRRPDLPKAGSTLPRS